ncbi:hypothetical protein GGS24DRAFT_492877 [Hypoxylon argillaceum]|nr:hypothetical protein GGS24DRAFT_492877 [Hypoxylon argillaceum]
MNAKASGTSTRGIPPKAPNALNGKTAGAPSQDTRRTRRTRQSQRREDPTPSTADPVQNTSLRKPPSGRASIPPITRLRKRQSPVDGETASNERQPKRVRLTRENLAHFNAMAGTKAKDDSASPTEKTTTTKTSSTASGFAVRIRSNGVVVESTQPPTNLEDLRAMLLRPRSSDSATESDFVRFSKKSKRATNESTLMTSTIWMLLKEYGSDDLSEDDPYISAISQQFTCFPENVGFNLNCSAPQPDFAEGLIPDEFMPFPVEAVSGALLYADNVFSLVLAHIAGEWKGTRKNTRQAYQQCAYTGAALVYARTQALNYLGEKDSSHDAKVITFAINGDSVDIFAHYASRANNGTLKYHQYLIKSGHLRESYATFRACRDMLRNAQDFAKEQSESLRDKLKKHGNNPPKLVTVEIEDEEHFRLSEGGVDHPSKTPPGLVVNASNEAGVAHPGESSER